MMRSFALFLTSLLMLVSSFISSEIPFIQINKISTQTVFSLEPRGGLQVDQISRLGRGVIHGLTWSPDDNQLIVVTSVGIWRYDTGNLETPPILTEIQTGWQSTSAFDPTNAIFASGGRNDSGYIVQLTDVQSIGHSQVIEGFSEAITSIGFSSGGSRIAFGDAIGRVFIYSAFDAEPIVLTGHKQSITSIAFAPNGPIMATTSIDGTVRLWNIETGVEVQLIADKSDYYRQFLGTVFSSDGLKLAYWNDTEIVLWNISSSEPVKSFQSIHPWYVDAHHVGFSSAGNLLAYAGTSQGKEVIHIWDVKADSQIKTFESHGSVTTNISFSPDGKILATAGTDNRVRLWDIETGTEITNFLGFASAVYDVTFDHSGHFLASANEDSTISFWDTEKNEKAFDFYGHDYPVNSVVFSPNDKLLASASQGDPFSSLPGSIRLWDTENRMELKSFSPSRNLREIALSIDGKLLAFTNDDYDDFAITLWDITNNTQWDRLEGHTSPITSMAFSSDGVTFATGDDKGDIWIWNIEQGDPMFIIHTGNYIDSLEFHPNENLLAVANLGGIVGFWDIDAQRHIKDLEIGNSQVFGMAFSPDGSILAVPVFDTVQLWDWSNEAFLTELVGHNGWVYSCEFNPEGTVLASAGGDGTIRLWNVREIERMKVS